MYLWRLFIAISLGLVWYLCDSGRTAAQYFICFLFFFTTPLLSRDSGRESSTQTDGETKDTLLQATVEEVLEDVPDGGIHVQAEPLESSCPLVKRSLQQVFECAYAQLVLPWYNVPELLEHQPLHRVLSVDVDFVIDQIIERAKDFNVCQVVVGSIRLLTQHLHNAKQSDRELAFFSRAEEVAILREFSGVLVRNLFPKSHWDQKVNRCALNEIVALKGLGLLVTWLSDPDNLNQLVVNQLDSVTPKGSVEELCGSDLDAASVASQEGDDAELSSEGAGVSASSGKAKKKRNKLKVHLSKFVDKMKSKKAKKKKMKKVEHELVMRAMEIPMDVSNEDDISSREGSVLSLLDSDREDSDLENYMTTVQEDMMEFKLSYEMWRVGCWAVSIPHADVEDEELVFSIHVEEKDSPENLHWDIKKTYMDVIYFRNRWQDSTNLPSITALEESEVNDEVKEEARVSVEHFLQELVSDNLIGHTQPVFLFLCPLDKLLNEEEHYGGVWGLLSGLASFLTPGQEEEESSSLQTQVPKEILTSSSSHLASTALPSENLSPAKDSPVAAATVPTIIVSTYDPPSDTLEEADAEAEPPSTNETCSQDKAEDSDNPFTSHFKMIFKGLSRSRSQESLVSAKSSSDDDPPDSVSPHCSQNGVLPGESTEGIMWRALGAEPNKKEKIISKLTGGPGRAKGKEQGTLSRAEDSRVHKIQAKWEQAEVTKALFDLLKEISGNSILMNVFDAMLKPFKPMLNKKVNSFLSTMDPTEAQVASLIDSLRDKQWPESQPAAASPPRSDEEKSETRERAHSLINGRYCSSLVLKKTDMDAVFNLFQKQEENKMLLYMLLSFLLRELFPNENSLTVSAAFLQKVINSSN